MKKSLQEIEDHYIRKGLHGDTLWRALKRDKIYQRILSKKKAILTKRLKVGKNEKKRYVLSTDQDYEILGKIRELEQKNLSVQDKKFVAFLRTQLEHDWRSPFIKILNKLLEKY